MKQLGSSYALPEPWLCQHFMLRLGEQYKHLRLNALQNRSYTNKGGKLRITIERLQQEALDYEVYLKNAATASMATLATQQRLQGKSGTKSLRAGNGKYCNHCEMIGRPRIGHLDSECWELHPRLRPSEEELAERRKEKEERRKRHYASQRRHAAWSNQPTSARPLSKAASRSPRRTATGSGFWANGSLHHTPAARLPRLHTRPTAPTLLSSNCSIAAWRTWGSRTSSVSLPWSLRSTWPSPRRRRRPARPASWQACANSRMTGQSSWSVGQWT